MGDVRTESFFGMIFDFESLPLDGRDVLLFSSFLIGVDDEFLLLEFVGRSNGGSFGLAILVIENALFSCTWTMSESDAKKRRANESS